jgi:ribosomal protein L24E
MRTYEDTFSGQKIYPGKVRYAVTHTDPPDVQISQSRCKHHVHLAEGHESGQLRG